MKRELIDINIGFVYIQDCIHKHHCTILMTRRG